MRTKIDFVHDLTPVLEFLNFSEREQFYQDWQTDVSLVVRNVGDRLALPAWSVPAYGTLLAYDILMDVKQSITNCIGLRIVNAHAISGYKLHLHLSIDVDSKRCPLVYHNPNTSARISYGDNLE
jgi:hypothetical protein